MAKKYEAKRTMKNRRCLICGHEIDSHEWTYNLKLRNGETEYVHAPVGRWDQEEILIPLDKQKVLITRIKHF